MTQVQNTKIKCFTYLLKIMSILGKHLTKKHLLNHVRTTCFHTGKKKSHFAFRMFFRINNKYFAKRHCIVGIYNEDAVCFCAVESEFGNSIEIICKFEGYDTFITEHKGKMTHRHSRHKSSIFAIIHTVSNICFGHF